MFYIFMTNKTTPQVQHGPLFLLESQVNLCACCACLCIARLDPNLSISALIVCVYEEPVVPEQAATVTEKLGEYLISVGYQARELVTRRMRKEEAQLTQIEKNILKNT